MPSALDNLINDVMKRPSATVRINGDRTRDVLAIEINSSINDTLTTANVTTVLNPGISPEDRIKITQGYNEKEQLTFTGFVDTVQYDEFEEAYVISARDILKKAMDTYLVQEISFGIDIDTGMVYYSTYVGEGGGIFKIHEYNNLAELYSAHPETIGNYTNEGVKAEAVVQWLLHMSGLEEGTEIQVDDTNFFIGDLKPAKFHLTSVYDAALQIANLIGWRLYADAAGVARFKKRPRNASGYVQWSYQDKSRSSSNILKITKNSTNTELRNRVEILGYSGIKYVARADSPYLGNTPYRGVLISNELIDTPGMAKFMGDRVLKDLNRLKETIDMEVEGNPKIYPGCTIRVRSRVANGEFLVEEVQSSMSVEGYRTQINASVYPGDTEYEEEKADIIAVFSPIQVASIGDPKYMVLFDGGASYSNRGEIVNWQWTWPDGTSTNSGFPQAWFTFDETELTTPGGVLISLKVTDVAGNTAVTTSGITLESLLKNNVVKYRHLYAALDTLGVGSLDCGLTWNKLEIPAVSVAASNFMDKGQYVPSGYAIFGCSDGTIHRTNDGALTSEIVFNSDGNSVDHVYIPELNGNYALAVVNSLDKGSIYRSDDLGFSWRMLKIFDTKVRQAIFDYTNYEHIIANCVGSGNIFESFDGGRNWTRINWGVDTNWMDSGALTNYFAHTGGIIGASGGASFPINGVSSNTVAMTVKIDQDNGIMAVDSAGQHWIYSSGVMIPTQLNSLNTTQHMIRDGELPVVYYATESGVSKSLDFNTTIAELYYPENVYGKMVAYGPLAQPITGKFYLFTHGWRVEQNPQGGEGQGVYVALNDNKSWRKLIDKGNHRNIAIRPGLIMVPNDGQDGLYKQIDAVFIQASGKSQLVVSGFWRSSDPDNLKVMMITPSRSTSKVYAVLKNIADLTEDHRQLLTWDDPIASSGYILARFMPDQQEDMYRSDYFEEDLFQAHVSAIDDRMMMTIKYNVIVGDNNHQAWSLDLKNNTANLWSNIGNDTDEKLHAILRHIKFPGEWTGWYYRYSTNGNSPFYINKMKGPAVHNEMEQGNTLASDVIRLWSPDWSESDVWDSAFYKTTIYYATISGVYKITGYGFGADASLYTTSSGYNIVSMTVTHDLYDRYDYITLLLARVNMANGNPISYHTKYSIDQGYTWLNGPDLPIINVGTFQENARVYYVDDPKSSSVPTSPILTG